MEHLMDSKKLLIIDDHTGVTSVIRTTAGQMGFTCETVNQPERAVATFLSFKPDLVILDMMMPETDGIDVLNAIMLTDIPAKFILTSGYGDEFLRMGEQIVKRHRQEAVSVLKKPFRREALVTVLTAASGQQA